jgi:hypothetical protein
MAQVSKEIPVYVVNLDMAQICEERPVCSTLRHGTDMSGDSCTVCSTPRHGTGTVCQEILVSSTPRHGTDM